MAKKDRDLLNVVARAEAHLVEKNFSHVVIASNPGALRTVVRFWAAEKWELLALIQALPFLEAELKRIVEQSADEIEGHSVGVASVTVDGKRII